jgi:hypothetical protein
MNWKAITDPDIRKMLEPENGSAKWGGWAFQYEKLKMMLALSESKIDNRDVKTYVLISQLQSVQGTKDRLVKLLQAKIVAKDVEGGQNSEVWRFTFNDKPRVLSFIDAEAIDMNMLNAGVSSDWTLVK